MTDAAAPTSRSDLAATAAVASPTDAVPGRIRSAAYLGAAVAVALAVVSLTADGSPAGAVWVRAGLVATWALAAVALASHGGSRLGPVAAAVAIAGGICAATAPEADLSWAHMVGAAVLPAAALHLELTIPEGSAGRASRRNAILVTYGLCLVAGLILAAADRRPSAPVVAAAVVTSLLLGLPAAHHT